jgi:hypothetical protein
LNFSVKPELSELYVEVYALWTVVIVNFAAILFSKTTSSALPAAIVYLPRLNFRKMSNHQVNLLANGLNGAVSDAAVW